MIKKIYKWLRKHKRYKTVILYGGAGAGKSYTLAHFLLFDIAMRLADKRILITRKTNPSLRLTTYRLFLDLLSNYQIPHELIRSEQTIILPNGTQIIFRGMDDPEKVKSAEFNYIWMEEATEFTFQDYQILRMRLRRATSHKNQIFLTFNPVSPQSWIYSEFFEKDHWGVAKLQVTYKDNPFLDDDYKAILEGLREEDETLYKIYTLGEFATPVNLIYTNWTVSDDIPEGFDEIIYGVDFGYNNPTAVLKIGIKDRDVYVLDEIYRTKMTNADLIEALKDFVHDRSALMYCDSAEPNRIEELYRAGFNAHPSDKSVKDGIDFVKRHKIVLSSKCVNTIKELKNYKWKEDKNGNILDEPVKFMNHACDALRYAVYTHLGKQQKTDIIFV